MSAKNILHGDARATRFIVDSTGSVEDTLTDQTVTLDGVTTKIVEKDKLIPWTKNREIDWNHVEWLQMNWEKRKTQTLVVCQDPEREGYYQVIVGNHTTWAAKGGGPDNLPELSGVKYLRVNDHGRISEKLKAELWYSEAKHRKNPNAPDIFWNRIHAGDVTSQEMLTLVRSIGRSIASNRTATSTNIACVDTLKRYFTSKDQKKKAAMLRVFALLGELTKGYTFNADLFKTFVELELLLLNGSLADSRWHKRVCDIGYDRMMTAIKQTSIPNRGPHNAKKWAESVLNIINNGIRNKNKLIANSINDHEDWAIKVLADLQRVVDSTFAIK